MQDPDLHRIQYDIVTPGMQLFDERLPHQIQPRLPGFTRQKLPGAILIKTGQFGIGVAGDKFLQEHPRRHPADKPVESIQQRQHHRQQQQSPAPVIDNVIPLRHMGTHPKNAVGRPIKKVHPVLPRLCPSPFSVITPTTQHGHIFRIIIIIRQPSRHFKISGRDTKSRIGRRHPVAPHAKLLLVQGIDPLMVLPVAI